MSASTNLVVLHYSEILACLYKIVAAPVNTGTSRVDPHPCKAYGLLDSEYFSQIAVKFELYLSRLRILHLEYVSFCEGLGAKAQ